MVLQAHRGSLVCLVYPGVGQSVEERIKSVITENFVVIPVESEGLNPIGIGSAIIRVDGKMRITIGTAGEGFGRDLAKAYRDGDISSITLVANAVER